ncbi:hypothetical protein ACQR1Y_12060 [Bradyrhizobium sp. HKCCYLRH3099]|uniref:hypothetical protein n=1 Tax=unclassified Bradyrhizobium TaxID=2631580 RepID=UPI003EBC83D3
MDLGPRLIEIVNLIEVHRLPLQDEKATQAELARVLDGADELHQREVRLSAADIVDFMLPLVADQYAGGIAIELKIKGQRRAIYRQLERYCAHEDVAALILATNVPMGLPDQINGKPVMLARLGRAWL